MIDLPGAGTPMAGVHLHCKTVFWLSGKFVVLDHAHPHL